MKIKIEHAIQIATQCEETNSMASEIFTNLKTKKMKIGDNGQIELIEHRSKKECDLQRVSDATIAYLQEIDKEKHCNPCITIILLKVEIAKRQVEEYVKYPQLFKKAVSDALSKYYDKSIVVNKKENVMTVDVKSVMPSMRPWLKEHGVEITGEETEA